MAFFNASTPFKSTGGDFDRPAVGDLRRLDQVAAALSRPSSH
ncbi:hypothetical protein [Anaerobiospirillum sp. NML120449]|nr:hypothetical protein [Anaerobiospirillum sp. NML120449]